jgi:hypothetical protein
VLVQIKASGRAHMSNLLSHSTRMHRLRRCMRCSTSHLHAQRNSSAYPITLGGSRVSSYMCASPAGGWQWRLKSLQGPGLTCPTTKKSGLLALCDDHTPAPQIPGRPSHHSRAKNQISPAFSVPQPCEQEGSDGLISIRALALRRA